MMNGQPSFLGKSLEAESLGQGPHFFITNGHSQIALACHFGETSQKIKKKKKSRVCFAAQVSSWKSGTDSCSQLSFVPPSRSQDKPSV